MEEIKIIKFKNKKRIVYNFISLIFVDTFSSSRERWCVVQMFEKWYSEQTYISSL